MALIRISLEDDGTALLVPEQFYQQYVLKLLSIWKREFEVARITDHDARELTDMDGKVWTPVGFYVVVVAQQIDHRAEVR